MIAALDLADEEGKRAEAINSTARDPKHRWSNRFADACARMVAGEVSRHPLFAKSEVDPKPTGKAEPATFLVGGSSKKIDVMVSGKAVGLQLGISLKGMNFRDRNGWQFDKNLTGRTYELENEVRVVHDTLPLAFMVALYFLPLAATDDKRGSAPSSFARTVEHLRSRVGRRDRYSRGEAERVDMAFVALYVPGDHEQFEYTVGTGKGRERKVFSYSDQFPRGVVRYFNVASSPPLRGRPTVSTTLDLSELVSEIGDGYRVFAHGPAIDWAEPESE